MNKNPKVSIITVTFNSSNTVRSTVESIKRQTYTNIEYIVVDGASKDDTLSIVQEYTDVLDVLISEPDDGIYDAMNKGILLAKGEIIGILNSDDVLASENVISQIVEVFQNNPESNCVFGALIYCAYDNLEIIRRYYHLRFFRTWMLRFGWMPPHPSTYIKRSVYAKYGVYKTDFEIAADYEFFVRTLLVGKEEFSQLSDIIVKMRVGGASTSGLRSKVTLNKEIIRACRENRIYTNFFLLAFKIPFKLLELIQRPKK